MPRRDVSPAASTEAPRGSRPSSQNALSGSCTGTAIQSSRTKPKRQLPLIEWSCASAQPLHGVPIESPWTTRAGQDILKTTNERGSNSAGRVPASQAGCRGFESRLPLRTCGRSCDRPLRASDLSTASFLRSASPHRLAPTGVTRLTPPPVALFPYRRDTSVLAGNPHPPVSLVAPTLTSRQGRDRREPRSCIPRNLLAASRPCPPGGVGRDLITTSDDALPTPRRAERTKSTRAIRTRSAHHTGSSDPRSACPWSRVRSR
jgi:hypothetical protein